MNAGDFIEELFREKNKAKQFSILAAQWKMGKISHGDLSVAQEG